MTRNPDSAASPAMDARMVRSRQALRNALLELVQHRPLEQITIRDITAQAQIGYATFFRHHPSKVALLHDLAAEQIDGLVAMALPTLGATDNRVVCVAMCRYVDEHRRLWAALLTGGAASALRAAFIRACRDAATQMPAHNWVPVDLAVVHAASAILEILAWWLRDPTSPPVEQVAELVDRLVIGPLTAR